jgi:hypothetical protein
MSGTRYIVEIDLRTIGNLQDFGSKSMGHAASNASKMQSGIRSAYQAASALSGRLMGVADRAAAVAVSFARWGAIIGGGAAIGAIAYGVKGINNELEKTQISLAAIFNAQGVVGGSSALTQALNGVSASAKRFTGEIFSPTGGGMAAGLQLAESTLTKMRRDAAKLPGEFSDLVNIFTTASIPGLQSGASVTKFADISAKAMAAGVVASMPLDQVGREFAMLLQGRAGAHNVFGMRLLGLSGDKAEEFNKKSSSERLDIVTKELDKYGEALDYFGSSFEGLFSTAVDNGKNLLRIATQPLFELAKKNLSQINKYLESPAAQMMAQRLGVQLRQAFEWGQRKIREWWPAIQSFAINAYVRLRQIWAEMAPAVERFAAYMKEALRDPGTIDKLIMLLKLYIAAKAGGAALGIGANAAIMAGGIRSLFAAGGGGVLAGTAGAALATGGTAVTTTGGAAVATAGGATAGGMALGGGALAIGATALAALSGIGAYYYQLNELRKDMAAGWKSNNGFLDRGPEGFTVSESRASQMRNTNFFGFTSYDPKDKQAIEEWAQREVERYRDSATAAHDFRYRIEALARKAAETGHPLDRLRASTFEMAATARQASLDIQALSGAARSFSASVQSTYVAAGGTKDIAGYTVKGMIGATMDQLLRSQGVDPTTGKAIGGGGGAGGPRHGGGGGGTTIQKVEIVVTSNQSPSRVAREVFDEFSRRTRIRRSSPLARNFSAAP